MATTTPNFGWAVPTSTDLVKDGAVAIETLGDAIDASLVDLKGGTSGQVLKKNSNTDMDFIWSADSAGMTNPMTTTGDTIYSSSGSTPARLGIGSTGQILTVAGGVPTWATPAAGGSGLTLINRTSVSAAASQSFNNVFSSTYENYLVTFNETAASTNGVISYLRLRASGSDNTSNYYYAQSRRSYSNTVAGSSSSGASEIQLIYTETGKQGQYTLNINAPQQAQWTGVSGIGAMFAESLSLGAQVQDTNAYDGFTIYVNSGTFTGIVSIYGLAKA